MTQSSMRKENFGFHGNKTFCFSSHLVYFEKIAAVWLSDARRHSPPYWAQNVAPHHIAGWCSGYCSHSFDKKNIPNFWLTVSWQNFFSNDSGFWTIPEGSLISFEVDNIGKKFSVSCHVCRSSTVKVPVSIVGVHGWAKSDRKPTRAFFSFPPLARDRVCSFGDFLNWKFDWVSQWYCYLNNHSRKMRCHQSYSKVSSW